MFGVIAVWLSQDKNERLRKYGPIFGLISQPFWFYTSYMHDQWGIFFLSILYTWSWLKGIKTYWMDGDKNDA